MELLVSQLRFTSMDSLEPRRLLSASIIKSVLTVNGTGKNDIIAVFLDKNDPHKIDVKINKTVTGFATSALTAIFIEGFAGDDQIFISETNGAIANNATVYGDGGNDSI